MQKKVDSAERMTSAELAKYLSTLSSKPSDFTRCPVCDHPKSPAYKFCRGCEKKGKKFRRDTLLGKARKHSEELAKKARLPRKNRKKGRVISKLMSPKRAKESHAATEPTATPRPKTILRKAEFEEEVFQFDL